MNSRVALLALTMLLSACGGGGGGGASTADLRIEVRDSESAAPRTATLGCGGSVKGTGFLAGDAKAQAACKVLDNEAAFQLISAGPPADRACTMVFGGPQSARVTGNLGGAIIDQTFKRTNGCEISDWTMLQPLLGEPQGQAGP